MQRSRRSLRALLRVAPSRRAGLSVGSLLVVILTVVVADSWTGSASGPWRSTAAVPSTAAIPSAAAVPSAATVPPAAALPSVPAAESVPSVAGVRSALTTRARGGVAHDGRSGWKHVARDDRGPAKAGQRQRGGQHAPHLVAFLFLALVALRVGRGDRGGAPRRLTAVPPAGGFLRRAPPPRTV